MLKHIHLMQTNRPLQVVKHWIRGDSLELSPPYQRGDVWGPIRRVNFIRSLLIGIPIPSVIINDRMSAEFVGKKRWHYAVIDGKQRLTTLKMFFQNQLEVPGEWFDSSMATARYADLSERMRRCFHNLPMAFSEGRIKTLKGEREVFELVNFGGVKQGETDVA